VGGEGRGGKGEEMTQTMYTHMNKIKIKKKDGNYPYFKNEEIDAKFLNIFKIINLFVYNECCICLL
jgi:hypothetical protein